MREIEQEGVQFSTWCEAIAGLDAAQSSQLRLLLEHSSLTVRFNACIVTMGNICRHAWPDRSYPPSHIAISDWTEALDGMFGVFSSTDVLDAPLRACNADVYGVRRSCEVRHRCIT